MASPRQRHRCIAAPEQVRIVYLAAPVPSSTYTGTPASGQQPFRPQRSFANMESLVSRQIGCYTCRLRRKKCDEITPYCSACQHLGLECEYKRPLWWSNNEARRRNKEDIKIIIKRKKLAEKAATHSIQTSVSPPPPSLSHSLPTSASGSDFYDRNRSASIDSRASGGFNFNSPPSGAEFAAYNSQIQPDFVYSFAPYEVDVKTERQMFVNDVPTMRESHVSTFSTMHTPPPPGTILPAGAYPNGWTEHIHQERKESLSEETLNPNFFDFSHGTSEDSRQVEIELEERDQRLLDHFIQFVMPTIFPILESNQHGSVGSDLVLPALQSNIIYLHTCLSTAAQHMKTIGVVTEGQDVNDDIMRHRYSTVWKLCQALQTDENHQQILEATLAILVFGCITGHPDDGLLDIAWHQHFQAAISLVQKLELTRIVSEPNAPMVQTPFNMTLTAWIDILGATMLGASPTFAHTYREKHLSQNHHLGLRELMGCEDRVMYLISEIACLESLKANGMDDFVLCQHVSCLGEQISLTEVGDLTPRLPFNANGTLSPKQLSKNITSAFRIATRIYLCSLVPGFSPSQPSPMTLVDKLITVLQCIPGGAAGYDRNMAWVYLMGGSIASAGSPLRALFEERAAALGALATCGSFGRTATVLREVWQQNDKLAQEHKPSAEAEVVPHVHWRDVMQMNGWDFLLI